MQTVIKVLLFLSLIFPVTLYSGAYRDTYKIEIQKKIYQLDQEIKHGNKSLYKKKRKKFLEKRLLKMQTVGVALITFTTGIKNREPIDSIKSISYKEKEVYLFTEISNMKDRYVTLVWYFNKKPISRKQVQIKRISYRVYSKITITKTMIGEWIGAVLDDKGDVLFAIKLQITK